MVTCIADMYFAPTKLSANNLIKEGDVNIILNYRNTAINNKNTIVYQSCRREMHDDIYFF